MLSESSESAIVESFVLGDRRLCVFPFSRPLYHRDGTFAAKLHLRCVGDQLVLRADGGASEIAFEGNVSALNIGKDCRSTSTDTDT